MSTTTCNVTLNLKGQEVLSTSEAPGANDESERTFHYSGFQFQKNITDTSTPKIEKTPVEREITLTSGTTTIDLTAAATRASRTIDNTGKKLVALLLKNVSTTNTVTIAPGSSNPYPLFGSGNSVVLQAGETIAKAITGVASGHSAVSGTVKNIDITGTNGEKLQLYFYFGT